MTVNEYVNEYMNEIELIKKQNNTEYDLYFVVADLLKKWGNIGKELSLRAVYNRRRSAMGQIFYGLSNFPDFVILDLAFDNRENKNNYIKNIDQVYGCIEIKGFDKSLPEINGIKEKIKKKQEISRDEGQLLGDVLWYKKVLYTNGYEWTYYEWNPREEECEHIMKIVEERIESGGQGFEWHKKIDFNKLDLDKIKEKPLIPKSGDLEDSSPDPADKWKKLITEIGNIKWK